MLFHVNSKTGVAGKCSATQGGCPFGAVEDHFTSPEAARASFENSQDTFTTKVSTDLKASLPDWHGKLPAHIEKQIAKKLNSDFAFLEAVDNGSIETRFADVEEFLSPPIYAARSRGSYFADEHDETTDDSIPEGTYLIAIHSRQGGGNRECYCDDYISHEAGCLSENNNEMESHPQYYRDEDDEYDSTYSTHYFLVKGPKVDVEKHKEQVALRSKASQIRTFRNRIDSGELPPWGMLENDGTALNTYSQTRQKLANENRHLSETQSILAISKKGIDAINTGTELTETEILGVARAAAYSSYQVRSFVSELEDFRRTAKDRNVANARVVEAEKLPASELRDYLLGDRGTGSYTTEEKRGRSKVKVTKTYERGSLLGKELEETSRRAESAKKRIKIPLDKLIEVNKAAKVRLDESAALTKTIEKQRIKAWAAGWPGLARDVPPVSEEF